MVGKRWCMARHTRAKTVPSPMPASKMRIDGGVGITLLSSRETRSPITHFYEQVLTKSRYFWRLSKKRNSVGSSPLSGIAGSVTGSHPRRLQRLLARTFHKCTRALASPLFPPEIFLSRWDPLVPHFFGKSPQKTKSCAIIAVIYELSGLHSINQEFERE